MSVVIKAENISKKYLISHQENKGRHKYSTLRESIYNIFSLKNKYSKEEFWALKDIDFEINQGAKIGIIGRNGAGKSTLLKLLSRITEPTTGKIFIKGRIASLLEVGTGFHPELTGRENIFLNGSILGMSYKEIKKKFDEIVDFASIENFLDTPVKRYSSGMYVRLAFSVAAHLNTDILLIDEVLAVGDADFQKKCLGKIDSISKSEGKTILFVSHNIAAISQLCNLAIVIDKGNKKYFGSLDKAINVYSDILNSQKTSQDFCKSKNQIIIQDYKLEEIETNFFSDYKFTCEILFYSETILEKSYINFVIENFDNTLVFHSRTDVYNIYPNFEKGVYKIKIIIPHLNLKAGIYNFWFRIVNFNKNNLILDSDKVSFEVKGPKISGLVCSKSIWSYERIE